MRIPAAAAVIAAIVLPAAPVASDSLRIPYQARKQLIGCWDAGQGQRVVLRARGKHLLVQPWGKQVLDVYWKDAEHAVVVQCRPRSQHGSFCLVAPDGNGGVQIRVYRKRHGSGDTGFLRESFVAQRCQSGS